MVKQEVTQVQYKVDRINFSPNFHIPSTKMGILMANIHVPVSTPVILFRIMEIPVTPPGASELGSRNKLTATA